MLTVTEISATTIIICKRPDGLTMVPWREGKPLTWDVTVVCPLAESYIGDSATNAGSAAEAAATRKAAKYAGLERTHIFQPVAVENLGTMNASAYGFLAGLGQMTVKPAICSSEFPF